MKILHIINSLATGGAEKLLLETLPKYNALGLKADLVLLNGAYTPFLKELQKHDCCEIFILGTGSPYHPKFILKLIPFFKKYDLVHVHLFPANYFAAFAKLISFSKTPLVFTEHSTSNRRFRNTWFNAVNKQVYKIFSRIICITEEVRLVVEEKTQIALKKLVVINNGVDLIKFIEAEPLSRQKIDLSLRSDDFLLIQVSSFRQAKDQGTVIRALTHLAKNVKLLLAGEGPLRTEHEDLVRDLTLTERVFFLGNRTDMPNLLKTCDAVVLSSNYEGLSLASIEGMASGKPFLASDVPGLREVVTNAGLLFPQGDHIKLAEQIEQLRIDPGFYDTVSQWGEKRASAFDINQMVEKHVTLYRSLINARHS